MEQTAADTLFKIVAITLFGVVPAAYCLHKTFTSLKPSHYVAPKRKRDPELEEFMNTIKIRNASRLQQEKKSDATPKKEIKQAGIIKHKKSGNIYHLCFHK